MVVGAKKTLQQVPSKGRISIMKIQNFTVQKKQSVFKVMYGTLLAILALISVIIDPVKVFTNWYLDIQEGKFIFSMWENPTYQLFSEVYVFNYTNVNQYLRGTDKTLKLQEIGPFRFQEFRTNRNLTVDREAGVMRMRPNIDLQFLQHESIAHYKDVHVTMPNIALVAISTLMADRLGYFANVGAYYSIAALGSTLFRNMTAEELLWGYSDPIVSIANKLLPGWIDFEKIGILDRFYAKRPDTAEVEIGDESRKFSLNSWNESPGLAEQGYTDLNTSIPCNRIKGSYEGLMLPPMISKDVVIPIFRKQACRIYPFSFVDEMKGEYGFNFYRFQLQESAFNKTSEYACKCTKNCLPDGFVDVSNCYYGFPIALSKPHYVDVDAQQQTYFEGMNPEPEKYYSQLDVEPTVGVPLALSINVQINVAVRTSPGNPITKPVKDKVLPIMRISLFCKEAPPEVIQLLRLRFVIAPPVVLTVQILLFIIGTFFAIQGAYRIWKPTYKIIQQQEKPKVRRKSTERRRSSIILNMSDNSGFKDDDDLAKEAVSLLAITEEDGDLPDLLADS
ncbi:scavenger receptor class B member 1 [Papilio machaon]|uniref:scavenger receptor class B member 1 n=1 Tax=Papilio machaon TaxID=76193 RepID=UPI001E6639FC|nr:scavenger receptor class B member 1 [Papilio machaon]